MNTSIAIIGGGPAGVACAVQLHRSGMSPVVYERADIGGTIRFAHLVENYPGFPEGIAGGKLASFIVKFFERWKISIVKGEVLSLSLDGEKFTVTTENSSDVYQCVIIATGTRPKRLNGVLIDNDALARIHYDVLAMKGRRYRTVAILGGGDTALDYALHLSGDSDVHLFHRGKTPRSIPLLYERARDKDVTFHEVTQLDAVRGAGGRITLTFRDYNFIVDALLPSLGREPVLDFIAPDLMKRKNELRRDMQLFFIGDVVNGPYRQAAIAAGDGLKVAMEVYEKWR